jgi:hypothetical protein
VPFAPAQHPVHVVRATPSQKNETKRPLRLDTDNSLTLPSPTSFSPPSTKLRSGTPRHHSGTWPDDHTPVSHSSRRSVRRHHRQRPRRQRRTHANRLGPIDAPRRPMETNKQRHRLSHLWQRRAVRREDRSYLLLHHCENRQIRKRVTTGVTNQKKTKHTCS